MKLTGAAADNYRQLTRAATFLVVDCEYTAAAEDDPVRSPRLISVAIVPVVAGKAGAAEYVELNPGVEVSAVTAELTGFTTEAVSGKRRFDFYAERIHQALTPAGRAVFVSHTAADVAVLAGEFARLDNANLGLPQMPRLDTSTLPRQLDVPGLPPAAGVIALPAACELLGVTYDPARAHHARWDARTTATVLLSLLGHAATAGWHNLDTLLAAFSPGTTTTTPPPRHLPGRGPAGIAGQVPAGHLAGHGQPPIDPNDIEQVAQLTELTRECVRSRCALLADEMAANPQAWQVWWRHAWRMLDEVDQPGQAGTLLGVLSELLPTVVPSTRAVGWWSRHKKQIAASIRCGPGVDAMCPACRAGGECPIDVFYARVARHAALCGRETLTKQTVKYKLFSAPAKKDRRVRDWSVSHPELAAAMAAMVVEWERDHGAARSAAKHLTTACEEFELYAHCPGLALLWVEHLGNTGRINEALTVAEAVLAAPTSEVACVALAGWFDRLTQTRQRQLRQQDHQEPSQRPWVARPVGHTHRNRFRVDVGK